MFNPDEVVIGGFFHELYPFIESSIREGAQETALTAAWLSCAIRRSGLGIDSALMGAAELVQTEVIANPTAIGSAPTEVAGLPQAGT